MGNEERVAMSYVQMANMHLEDAADRLNRAVCALENKEVTRELEEGLHDAAERVREALVITYPTKYAIPTLFVAKASTPASQAPAVPTTRDSDEAVLAALTELVALKDMKDRLAKLHEMGHGTDYHLRQPLAWDKARAAITQAASTGGKS